MRRLIVLLLVTSLAAPALEAQTTAPAVDSVRLIRTGRCASDSAVDEMILRSNGEAAYMGYRSTPRTGAWNGRLPQGPIDSLAAWLRATGTLDSTSTAARTICVCEHCKQRGAITWRHDTSSVWLGHLNPALMDSLGVRINRLLSLSGWRRVGP
jgi:hypothetical protein